MRKKILNPHHKIGTLNKERISRFIFILSFILFSCVFNLKSHASAQSISLEEYRKQIILSLELLEFIQEQDGQISEESIRKLEGLFGHEQVVVVDNKKIRVKNRWFRSYVDDIKGTETQEEFKSKTNNLQKKLALLFEETGIPQHYYSRNPESLIDKILSRREFQKKALHPLIAGIAKGIDSFVKNTVSKIKDGINSIVEKIASFIERFTKYLPSPPNLGSVKGAQHSLTIFLYFLAGGLGIAFIICFVKYKWYAYFFKLGKGPSYMPVEQVESVKLNDWQVARHRAEDALRDGNLKLAFHYLYLSLLLFLDDKKFLVYHESTTNWEYIRQLRHSPHLHKNFRNLTRLFEQIWYGDRVFGLKDYNEFISGYNQIITGVDL